MRIASIPLRRTAPALLAVAMAASMPARGASRSIAVAVAANLKPAFEEIATQFQAKHPGVEVKATYGASGNFFAQISNGAPFDLFLSADADFPARLAERGLADGKAFTYAHGKLVVWVPNASRIDLDARGLAALVDHSVKRVAVANPDVAPYGRAAKQALERAGLYDRLAARIVVGQSVSQAAQFAESGNAQAAFVPLSLARSAPLDAEGRAWPVPRSAYDGIDQAGVVLKGAREAGLARELAAFLRDGARPVLEKYGYDVPGR